MAMVLLSYRLRPGTDHGEFDRFMDEVDVPVFRAHPKVRSYRPFRIAEDVQGELAFTHFDLLEVDDPADLQEIFDSPEIAAHATQWLARFGEHGSDVVDQAQNFRIQICDEYSPEPGT